MKRDFSFGGVSSWIVGLGVDSVLMCGVISFVNHREAVAGGLGRVRDRGRESDGVAQGF